jgi:hypothetical protein
MLVERASGSQSQRDTVGYGRRVSRLGLQVTARLVETNIAASPRTLFVIASTERELAAIACPAATRLSQQAVLRGHWCLSVRCLRPA